MEVYLSWIQSHLLQIFALILTLILFYHYLIEKDTGVKLSKRYRNSIYEAQSKVFLSATQYLISGNRDLAIKEFLNAVDLNRETIETYFALGGLFRSNGETDKAISIHRSLIARENISEAHRVHALKELAVVFDKGGFIDKAIDTYKDVLKINRDQYDVIQALCKIFEDIEDWDQAYNYRMMLSKVGHINQSETISHILVQKAKHSFEQGNFVKCSDELEEAFRFAPSVSAKILKLKLYLTNGNLEQSKHLILELLKEHPMYASFIFETLEESFKSDDQSKEDFKTRYKILTDFFLNLDDQELLASPSVLLSKVRLLEESSKFEEAYNLLNNWMDNNANKSEVLKTEYLKLLIKIGKKDKALYEMEKFLESLNKSITKHYCNSCGYNSDEIFWRCPQCKQWETIQFRWKV